MDSKINLMEQFSRVTMLFHRFSHHIRNENEAFADPNRGQGRILALLKTQPKISQKEISNHLDMSNQALSQLLTKLEKSGHISRTQSETDRRVMNIELTQTGREAAMQAEQSKQDSDKIFNCLSDVEKNNLSEYLSKIIAELEKQLGENSGLNDLWDAFRNAMGPNGEVPPKMLEMMEKHYKNQRRK
ncbi:MarR family winged helix-turn-helix transcriptional regulator [Clostridium beijerinckii]|uniref:MarR family winged helix-turn-helix transcriptional regulator n=1 Tax=Clostridium beijerinckii TaxID=1520 RepID=UPI00098CE88A|nr:MarR family transcriptional regulator [Clostridium beijerinckii]NRT80505.1 DNA-binding MarR family transcriptional regulator [Clostridium beijerinckii]OOM37959.1 transcriptional repressor MprA [Clostridium beijerinckii]